MTHTASAPVKRKPRAPRERLMFRVEKGAIVPADNYTVSRLRSRGYRRGDIISADLKKPRNPGFHRLAHRIGQLCVESIEEFDGMDAHAVLKRLQWEANIGCEEMGVQVPGVGLAIVRIPRSLSFSEMDDGEFREIVAAFCRHIAARYWPGLDADAIESMAESFVEPA